MYFFRCLFCFCIIAGHTWEDTKNSLGPIKVVSTLPFFDDIGSRIDGISGQTVLLPCTVRNLGDKVVC